MTPPTPVLAYHYVEGELLRVRLDLAALGVPTQWEFDGLADIEGSSVTLTFAPSLEVLDR